MQAEYTEWGVTYKSNELPFKVRTLHLNDYSWREIQQIIASGQAPVTFAECFENGCCKEIQLSAGTTTIPYNKDGDTAISAQNIYVNILGFDHDESADGDVLPNVTFGMAAAEERWNAGDITFKANQRERNLDYYPNWLGDEPGLMEEYVRMEVTNSNSNGYTVMTHFLDTVYNQCLPAELKDMIIPVTKKASAGNSSPEIVTTAPHLFLFSEVELSGQWYMNTDGSITEEGNNKGSSNTQYGSLSSYEGEGSQYAYYSCVNDKTTLNLLKCRLSRSYDWSERSPGAYSNEGFCRVVNTGQVAPIAMASNIALGVSFGFCIGG